MTHPYMYICVLVSLSVHCDSSFSDKKREVDILDVRFLFFLRAYARRGTIMHRRENSSTVFHSSYALFFFRNSMYTMKVLWIFIFVSVIVQAVEKKLDINPEYPLTGHMLNLESELQPNSAESTYVRVIVWNTMPTRQHLQAHFDKFDRLKLEEERLANGKFDIVVKSKSTYERFLYVHYPEQQSFVTIFVKVNFNKKNPSLLKNFIRKVNEVLRKYGFINTIEIEHDQIDSDDSSRPFVSTLDILIFVPLFIYCMFNHFKTKTTSMILIIFHRIISLIVLL